MDFDSLPEDSQTKSKKTSFDELPEDTQSKSAAPSFDELPEDTTQTAQPNVGIAQPEGAPAAGLESFVRHATYGLSDKLAVEMRKKASDIGVPEEYLNYVAPSPQTIEATKEAHPTVEKLAGFGGDLAAMARLPNVVKGSRAIAGAIKMGLTGAGDEYSKSILGVGDPALAAAGHIVIDGALGYLGGLGGEALSKYSDAVTKKLERKFGSKFLNYIGGNGHVMNGGKVAASPEEAIEQMKQAGINPDLFDYKEFMQGQKDASSNVENMITNAITAKGAAMAATTGYKIAGGTGASTLGPLGGFLANKFGKIFGKKIAPTAEKMVVGPVLTRMAANGTYQDFARSMDYGLKGAKGCRLIEKGIDNLFQSGLAEGLNWSQEQLERRRKETKDYVDSGAADNEIDQSLQQSKQPQAQGFAHGGKIQPTVQPSNPIAENFPEQNELLAASKIRVANYLKANKPMPPLPQLPYDKIHKDPDKERAYDKLIDLANNPLSILKRIKDGSLTPKHMKDFTAMYPEVYGQLSSQITKRIYQGKLDQEKRPPHRIRQSLSMFLGANLDSTLTQPNIMAAQQVFMAQKFQQQQNMAKTQTSLNKLAQKYQTPSQAAEQRLNKS